MENKSVFSELAEYFKEKYFSPDLSGITNYDTTDVQRFLPLIIVGLCIGTFLAVCISYYNGDYIGKVVRRLYKSEAFSPEKAKTLTEIDCNSYLYRRNLTRDTVLAKYVKPTSELKGEKDAESAAFYILEDKKYIADKRFKKSRFGILTIVFAFIICIVVCFALLYIAPDVLQLADNVTNMLKPK
ncbi:MAG: hypothetical protein IJA60_04575 [Clostridia bacterium]|nr:hypothetical protein [Clostridia bacterium]